MAKKITLQDRIKTLQPYFLGFEIKETLYILRIAYPNRWSAYNRDDELIKVTKSDSSNEWYYYADINEVDLNELFDLVEDTIQTNESVTKKIELMRLKMEELKDLFQTEDLEKLETLQFTFNESKKQKRVKRQYNKKKSTQTSDKIETLDLLPKQDIVSNEPLTDVYTNEDIENIKF